jgi:hypothetical protein
VIICPQKFKSPFYSVRLVGLVWIPATCCITSYVYIRTLSALRTCRVYLRLLSGFERIIRRLIRLEVSGWGAPRTALAARSCTVPVTEFAELLHSTHRAMKGFSGAESPSFRYRIRRNPPMSLRVASRRILGLVA